MKLGKAFFFKRQVQCVLGQINLFFKRRALFFIRFDRSGQSLVSHGGFLSVYPSLLFFFFSLAKRLIELIFLRLRILVRKKLKAF